MSVKRIPVVVAALSICIILLLSWYMTSNDGGAAPYPINLGSFVTIGSTTVDPSQLLENIRSGKDISILQTLPDTPDNPSFVMTVGWSQNDYLEIANAYHRAIWRDNPIGWHLYKALFFTSCDDRTGKFKSADLYYYQEVTTGLNRKYAVRNILIEPEYGYIAWGGDTFFPRPILGWPEINLENIQDIPAENALELAEQRGGHQFRDQENNVCQIIVGMWPWGYERSDWRVYYSGKKHSEMWIPSK